MGTMSQGTERRVFVGGMPFSYEVGCLTCMPLLRPPLPLDMILRLCCVLTLYFFPAAK